MNTTATGKKKQGTGLMTTKDVLEVFKATGLNKQQFSERSGHTTTWLTQRIKGTNGNTPLYPRSEARLVNAFPQKMREYLDADYIKELRESFPEEFNGQAKKNKGKSKTKVDPAPLDVEKIKQLAVGRWVLEGHELPDIDDAFMNYLINATVELGGGK